MVTFAEPKREMIGERVKGGKAAKDRGTQLGRCIVIARRLLRCGKAIHP